MPCEVLIHAYAHNKALKGSIQEARDLDELSIRPWGVMEGLPDFIQLEITDATAAQVENYVESVRNIISYELVNSNAQGRRYRLYVHPNLTSLFGGDAGIKKAIRDYLVNDYGAVLVSNTATEGVFDIPNTDWQALRDDILDLFETQIAPRRWYLNHADVDLAVSGTGKITMTSAEAITKFIDRLA